MIHIRKEIEAYPINKHILEKLYFFLQTSDYIFSNYDIEKTMFLNIHTTGMDPTLSRLSLVTIGYYFDNNWIVEEWMTESKQDEIDLIEILYNLILFFDSIITYNGDNFDIPYMVKKMEQQHLDSSILNQKSIDLYHVVRLNKHKYQLQNAKLLTLEHYLGITKTYQLKQTELNNYYTFSLEGNQEHMAVFLQQHAENVIYLMAIFMEFYPHQHKYIS